MKNRYQQSHYDDHNLFLTATYTHHSSITQNVSHHSTFNTQSQNLSHLHDSRQTIQTNILILIKEFKALNNSPQISHLFNQILHGLDGSYDEKKTIDKIAIILEKQQNLIKLNRVWNRLKALKKGFDRIGLQKIPKPQVKISHSQKNSYARIKASQPSSSSNTFHRTMSSQVNEFKQNILSQISYRERLTKIQSDREKHESNRQKFIHKRLVKAKEMNKKVKYIYEKNINMQKQQYSNHKYEQLYDPEEEKIKKRGKYINSKAKYNPSTIENEVSINSNERCITSNVQSQGNAKVGNKTKKNINFLQKEQEKFTKQDLMTFKSLKDLISQNIKASKSFKTITNSQQHDIKLNIFTASRSKQLYRKLQDKKLNRSHSLGKKQNLANEKAKQTQDQKLNSVINKRLEIEDERLRKIITQAVQKEKKIQLINQRRTQGKAKNNQQEESQQDLGIVRSTNSSPTRSLFKRVLTRKELLDKEKRLFAEIENKLQKKEQFLQDRVQRVRERLKKEQETKERRRRAWEEQIHRSQNASGVKRPNPSLSNKENLLKIQQMIVKNSHFCKLKKMESHIQKEKLAGLTIHELKSKLAEIDAEEEEKRNQIRVIF